MFDDIRGHGRQKALLQKQSTENQVSHAYLFHGPEGTGKRKLAAEFLAEQIAKGSAVPATALRGATKEDLQAHFEELKALIPEATKKGAVGPYVPGEGTTSAGSLGGPGQEFADWFNGQLGR